MSQPDVRYATASREWGLRRVRRLTWVIAGTGAVSAALLAAGFGSHAHPSSPAGQPARPSQGGAGNTYNGSTGGKSVGGQIPGGGQQLQAPPASPLPGSGGGQVVSGGS
jgi:hypothetical protein